MSLKKNVFLSLLLAVSFILHAQTDIGQAPYKRFPHVPPLQLLLGDSTTVYKKEALPKGKPVLLIIFSPECSHCQHAAEDIVAHKDALKNIEIVMATLHTITQMNDFVKTYGLGALPNVVVGKDVHYILPPFYSIQSLPYMAFYKANGDLMDTIEGSLPMEKVVARFKNAGQL